MKMKFLGVIAFMAGLSTLPAAATTYNISESAFSLSVLGTITTDGDTGVLSAADITSWSLTVSGDGTPITLNNADFTLTLLGNDLSATATTLSFNFGGPGTLSFYSPACYPCANVTYITGFFELGASQSQDNVSFWPVPESGNLVIGTTPLPAALPLFASGLGAMGLLGWRRRRKNTAPTLAAV